MTGEKVVVVICGGGILTPQRCSSDTTFQIGQVIAQSGCDMLTGGCPGYPDLAAQGFLSVENHGRLVCISPWSEESRHLEVGFPFHKEGEYEYSGIGPGRNGMLVDRGHIVTIFPGGPGTWSEYCMALKLRRRLISIGDMFDLTKHFTNEISWKKHSYLFGARTAEDFNIVLEQIKAAGNFGRRYVW